MNSARKLAAALALLITLLVAAYFILTSLQTAISSDQNSVIMITSQEPSTTSASTEPITRPRVNQSRLVELTTTQAPPTSDKSLVRTLEVKPAPSNEQADVTISKEPAMAVEAAEPSSKVPIVEGSSPSASFETSSAPSTPSMHSSQTTDSGSSSSISTTTTITITTSETPISLSTTESATSKTTETASETTPITRQTTPIPASTEAATSSSSSTIESTTTTTATTTTTSAPTTPSPTTVTTSVDSEKLYKETTAMPADGFQMAPEEERAWQEFRQKFRKSYQSIEEERQRADKFVGNLRFINAHNRMPQVSFQLGVNQFADLSRDEINARHIGPLINWTNTLDASGATKPPQMRILEEDQATGEGAQGIDWRNSSSLPPLDQGLCPESALFSVISSLEASLELAGFKGMRLSPRQLIDCLTYGAPPPPAWPPVCSGHLSMVTLWEFLQRQSIRLVSEQEYEQFRGAQMQGLAPPQTCIPPLPEGMRDQRPKVVSYHQVPGEHFEVALQNRGPLVVAIDASRPTFHFYKSGFYHELQCSSDVYNMHALLVASKPASPEGSPNGTPAHFTLRASLGVNWGDSGHIHLLKEPARNKCLPEQLATYPDLGFE